MLALDPQYHHVRQLSLSDWLSREFPDRPLFLFFNSFADTWEIGEWTGGTAIIERCIIGPSPQMFSREMAVALRRELNESKAWAKGVAKQIRSEVRRGNENCMDEQAAFQDFMKFCDRRYGGRDELTHSLAQGGRA